MTLKLKGCCLGRFVRTTQIANSFTFIVGEKRYVCPWHVADFLSPSLARCRSVDPSIAEYVVQTPDLNGAFGLFLALGRGQPISIAGEAGLIIAAFATELGTAEVCEASGALRSIPETFRSFDDLIAARASELSELDDETWITTPEAHLFDFVGDSRFQPSSEDDFCDFLSERADSPDYLSLFRLVRFDCLSAACMSRFLSRFRSSIKLVGPALWKSLCERLLLPVCRSENVHLLKKTHALFDGIIGRLTAAKGGNVHDAGIVTVTSNSVYSDNPRFSPRNVTDFTNFSEFVSGDDTGEWIQWDFQTSRVHVTGYVIQSSFNIGIKSWRLEISDDGRIWEEIDSRVMQIPVDQGQVVCFSVENTRMGSRVRLISAVRRFEASEDKVLALRAFEIFGELHPQGGRFAVGGILRVDLPREYLTDRDSDQGSDGR